MKRINSERFLDLMKQQAQIGATPEGGLTRPALSAADIEARAWFKSIADAHNLTYQMDGAGNQSAILRSRRPDAKTLLIGSHLDSVPNGGRFDGALGVVAALEAVLTLQENQIELPFHVEVINFTDEEGTLVGLLGSSALTGLLLPESVHTPRGGRATLEAGMARLGLSDESMLNATRNADELFGYIEVHIEQGTRLEEAKLNIGVVNSIVGIRSMWITFNGIAAHAGTMPMNKRHDAFWGASEFSLKTRDHIMQNFHPGVINFGDINIAPAAFNIVPNKVNIGVEFRHGEAAQLNAMEEAIINIANEAATKQGLTIEVSKLHDIHPAPMSPNFVNAVENACDTLDLSHKQLLSFAGHDAQALAQVTNSVMYFVPSVDGISHNPKEFTSDEDCINAANVMLHTILQLV